jgi:hypothetical protein
MTDKATLYILSGSLDETGVRELFDEQLAVMRDKHGIDYTKEPYLVKVLPGHTPDTGYGYIRVSNPGLYNCIVGKTPDGKDRVRYERKPLSDFETPFNPPFRDDMSNDEKFEVIKEYLKEFDPDYDTRIFAAQDASAVLVREEPLFGIMHNPEKGMVHISPADITLGNVRNRSNEMYTSGVKGDVDPAHIKRFFKPFATTKSTVVRGGKGRRGDRWTEEYPTVSIVKSKGVSDVMVSFHPGTSDGRFAMLFHRNCEINGTMFYFRTPNNSESYSCRSPNAEIAGRV